VTDLITLSTRNCPPWPVTQSPEMAGERTRCAGLVLRDELCPAPEPLTDEASKVGALPQTPPGAEPLDLNTCARFR
jgi:hypothetical protein